MFLTNDIKNTIYGINWRFVIGVIFSIIAIVVVVRGVDWKVLLSSVRKARIEYISLGMFFLVCDTFLRAWRWQILLRPLGKFRLIKDSMAFAMIGYMANMILPLRAGEIVRPVMFGEKTGTSKSAVFATVIVERIFEVLSLLILLVMVTVTMEIPSEIKTGAYILEGVSFSLFISLLIISYSKKSQGLINKSFSWLPGRIQNKLEAVINQFVMGLRCIRNFKDLWFVFLISILMWMAGILMVYYNLKAFYISIPWYGPVFVTLVANIGMAVPSSPGSLGVAHFLYVFSLAVFNVEKSVSLGFAIVFHAISFILIILTGLAFLWYSGLNMRYVKDASNRFRVPV